MMCAPSRKRWEDVCRYLLPSGKAESGLWVARNPRFNEGRKKPAFKVRIHGGEMEKDGPFFPAVHTALRTATGITTACHVTFLDPTRPAKAPIAESKMIRGIAKGAIAEVSMGRENKPFWQSEEPRPVILAEGIETAASLAIALDEYRVWPCGSLSGIGHAPVSIPCVSEIYFARDNNDGNAQAQKQFESAHDLLEQSEKPVAVMASHIGDDFNDLANGEEDE